MAEDYSLENLDEVLLTELQAEDGSQRYIVYRNGGLVDAAELEALCDKVGWPRRPQNKVQAALANSFLVATLTLEDAPPRSSSSDCSDGSSSGSGSGSPPTSSRPASSSSGTPGRLIGLARCTSDGAFNATLWDVLVDPEFQGQVGLPAISPPLAPIRTTLASKPVCSAAQSLGCPGTLLRDECGTLQGLGKALVEGVTRTLLKRDITNITLFADSAGKP